MKYTIPAIIFAGGKSSRMGKDKALLPFKKYSTLSEFQYHKLQQWFDEVYISAKTNKFPFTVQVVKDKYEESSPLVGIISVFETLKSEAVFILSVDAPLVDENVVKTLWEAYKEDSTVHAIIAQSPSGLQPLCGIYKKDISPLAKANFTKNKHSLKALLDSPTTKIVHFKDNALFTNVNTQEEYLNLLNNFN
ncbi:MAG: molybdenum cofactor guanylyltransferase MobA [Sulfurovum sp.]|nr:molybdenum cofactor guanylyltransferase MobA [Sulfurovum sp.]